MSQEMAKRIGDSNCWVRIFEVTEPTRHRKGFTVYKVTSTVFPKAFPESATRIIVWKRYSDFQKLHKELEQIFKQLYLRGEFPLFPKAKLFGRFEHEVVEERRSAALALLEFTANYTQLFTHKTFIQFFENGYISKDFIGKILFSKGESKNDDDPPNTVFAETSEINAPCLEPQKVWNPAENPNNEEECMSLSASSLSSSLSPDNPEATSTITADSGGFSNQLRSASPSTSTPLVKDQVSEGCESNNLPCISISGEDKSETQNDSISTSEETSHNVATGPSTSNM